MGKRGPQKTPLKLLKARGSLKAIGRSEPEIPAECPTAPEWLSDLEREAWKHVCEVLGPMGIVTRADRFAMESLCAAYARWREARDLRNEEGMTQETVVGTSVHPCVGVEERAWKNLVCACREFGLSPASRTNVSGGKAPAGDEKSKFFKVGS